MLTKTCTQPVGRGTVAENRRCGALPEPGWRICAAHLALARQRYNRVELHDKFAARTWDVRPDAEREGR